MIELKIRLDFEGKEIEVSDRYNGGYLNAVARIVNQNGYNNLLAYVTLGEDEIDLRDFYGASDRESVRIKLSRQNSKLVSDYLSAVRKADIHKELKNRADIRFRKIKEFFAKRTDKSEIEAQIAIYRSGKTSKFTVAYERGTDYQNSFGIMEEWQNDLRGLDRFGLVSNLEKDLDLNSARFFV